MLTIKGCIQKLGDDVDTDQILPGYAMAEPADQLGKFALAGAKDIDFKNDINTCKVLVAGKNFGCGSSREQAPLALKQAGVSLVIARSFARIFRRNSINIGLPVLIADIYDEAKPGDFIDVDLRSGLIVLNGSTFETKPLSETVCRTLQYGGLIRRVRADLGLEKTIE